MSAPNLSRLTELAGRRLVAAKYLLVSAANLANHQLVLLLANWGWGWGGGRSNAFAAVVAAGPAYLMSRYWVWQVRGRHSLRAEVLPFWIIALLGLAVSTVFAEIADRALGPGLWVAAASFSAYFLVWLLKFLVLDGLFTRADKDKRVGPEKVAS